MGADSPETSKLGVSWAYNMGEKQETFLGPGTALTFDIPGQIQVDPGKAPLSFQGEFLWLQVTHLDLESLAEDSRHSRQVGDFQYLLFARSDVTLQGVGQEGGLVMGSCRG